MDEDAYTAGLRDGAHKAIAFLNAVAEKCERDNLMLSPDGIRELADQVHLYRDTPIGRKS